MNMYIYIYSEIFHTFFFHLPAQNMTLSFVIFVIFFCTVSDS